MSALKQTVKRFTPEPVRRAVRRRVLDPLGNGGTLVPEVELQQT
jgi:hypothetical protein